MVKGAGNPDSVKPESPELVQVGWRSKVTGVICDCPVYERSPHANSEPVYVVERTK